LEANDINTRLFWQHPWKYKESFVIALGMLFIGIAIEYATGGKNIIHLAWPNNLILGLVFLLIILLLHIFFKNNPIVKWLSSIPAAISSISLFAVLALLMGFIPQNNETGDFISKIGFTHITKSIPYLFAQIFFLVALGLVTIKRVLPFKASNIGFILNHLGLWITIFAASLGTGDLTRLTMNLYENETVWYAYNEKMEAQELPIALKLLKFDIEEYNPKIALIDNETGDIIDEKDKGLNVIEEGATFEILDYKINVIQLLKNAGKSGERYYKVNHPGACNAAQIGLINDKNIDSEKVWISCGSYMVKPEHFTLNDKHTIVMLPPEPKKFSSEVQIYSKSGINETAVIEVNKPVKYDDWKIYQVSYDENLGKWSNLSVVELVKDPWLPIVYTGIFMLIIGSIFLFWKGEKITKKRNENKVD